MDEDEEAEHEPVLDAEGDVELVSSRHADLQHVVELGKKMLDEVEKNWKPQVLDAAIKELDRRDQLMKNVIHKTYTIGRQGDKYTWRKKR